MRYNLKFTIMQEADPMAPSHTTDTDKTRPRFFFTRTLLETGKAFGKRLEHVNKTVIEKKRTEGHTLARELREQPLERLDTLLDQAQDLVGDLSDLSRKTYLSLARESRTFLKKAADRPFTTLGDTVESVGKGTRKTLGRVSSARREILGGLGGDLRLIRDDIADLKANGLDHLKGLARGANIGDTLTRTLHTIPSLLNLPSRKAMDQILEGIETINAKIDTLENRNVPA
jgi:hypothetical protein